jgi:hypothetical protein
MRRAAGSLERTRPKDWAVDGLEDRFSETAPWLETVRAGWCGAWTLDPLDPFGNLLDEAGGSESKFVTLATLLSSNFLHFGEGVKISATLTYFTQSSFSYPLR